MLAPEDNVRFTNPKILYAVDNLNHRLYNSSTGSSMQREATGLENGKTLMEFGAVVLSLMGEKGVTSQAMLIPLLRKQGLNLSQAQISKYLYGKATVSRDFPTAFADALELDISQRGKLADAYTFGQRKAIKSLH